jgi:hypothetical protein
MEDMFMGKYRYYKAGITSLLLAVAIPLVAFATTNVTVNSTESAGWTMNPAVADNRPNGNAAVTAEYGAPAGFGTSSLEVNTLDSTAKVQVVHPLSTPVLLSDVSELSYSTYRSSASTANEAQLPAINLVIDYNGDAAGGFATLVYEPVYQTGGVAALSEDTWQNWDASGDAIWWSTKVMPGVPQAFTSYVSFDAIKAANPNAVVQAFMVNQGSGNAGLFAAVDAFNFNGTVYNFEQKPDKATSKEQCKNYGWQDGFVTNYKNQGDCVSSVVSQKNK